MTTCEIKDATVVAVIPVRGGSKGLERKNLRLVGGEPLVARSIATCLNAALIDSVFVSTDDSEIAAVAARAGAEVIERPTWLATDSASSESALLHALDVLESENRLPTILAFVQCTTPLLAAEDLDAIVDVVRRKEADCSFTAAPSHRLLWRVGEDGAPSAINHDARTRPRRQDMEEQYVETGAYAFDVTGFRRHGRRFFGRLALHPVEARSGLEVDSELDLVVVEAVLGASTGGAIRRS